MAAASAAGDTTVTMSSVPRLHPLLAWRLPCATILLQLVGSLLVLRLQLHLFDECAPYLRLLAMFVAFR